MRRRPSQGSTGNSTLASALLRVLAGAVSAMLVSPNAVGAPTAALTPLSGAIPSQPLAQALETFAAQYGLQLVYFSEIAHGKYSHAVPPGLGATNAIKKLLQGTGLQAEYLTDRSMRVFRAGEEQTRDASSSITPSFALQEVIVTSNRREETQQRIPMSVQVLTGEAIAKINATTFDDFVKFLPAVTAYGVGPGQNNIYIRGLATATGGIQSSGLNGPFPNVAVYLDEQSVQLPNRNLDVYAADLERIEVLEGPQGTLFGAGAQAGVVRYIANKPQLGQTQLRVNVGAATTAGGSVSKSIEATLNVPVIADKLAIRALIYDEKRGGYIDNPVATFRRAATDPGVGYFFNGQVPANSVELSNVAIAARDINPVSYKGLRIQALYRFNENWDALIGQSIQRMEADGVFTQMAKNSLGEAQPDLSTQLYNFSSDVDKFENTSIAVKGRAGGLKVLYAGSFLVRNVEQVQDYTQYARAPYADYYQCVGPGLGEPVTAQCFTPSSTWREQERNTHQAHELRVSSSGEGRIRGVGGLFYESYRIQEQVDWFYLSALPYFHPIGPPTGYYTLNGSSFMPAGAQVQFNSDPNVVFVPGSVTSNNPNVRLPSDGFFNDITRGYQQKAVYASFDFQIVPKKLTLTLGTRYARTTSTEVGSSVSSGGCESLRNPSAPNPCVNHSFIVNIDSEHLNRTYSGFNNRANLSWNLADDLLVYYTWSQGFRAAGFNRAPLSPSSTSPLAAGDYDYQKLARQHGGFVSPVFYVPDRLTNEEVGWKTMWKDRRIQLNGALYQELWEHAQLPLQGPADISAATYNGGDFRVRGLEISAVARVSDFLTIQGAAAWNHSELVTPATFHWRDGTPIDFSLLRTANGGLVSNPAGPRGSPLAGAPPFQGNLQDRYEFAFHDYDVFAQVAMVHQSHSLASNYSHDDLQGHPVGYDLDPFTEYSAAVGCASKAWQLQFYANNLTNSRSQLFKDYAQWYEAITVSRPRTIGLRLSFTFSGH